jgi:heterodisulfide reductase subunit B
MRRREGHRRDAREGAGDREPAQAALTPRPERTMAKKRYAFYPGCSSQPRASASNYLASTNAMCRTLDIELTPIPDWNCCGASIGYAGASELSRHVLNARNFALAQKHLPGRDIVATCAACWLNARESKERLDASAGLLADTNEALKEAGLRYDGESAVKHMVEVLIDDFGYDALAKPVVKPLDGIRVAGYVGCQTNRPFGIAGESFENPVYLDRLVETVGAEPIAEYDQKVTCCGGALAFSEPDKSQKQIRDIVESAYDHGADMIVTPCPLCQANVEVYQSEINRTQGTSFAMPVAYYSELMSVAYGGSARETGLDGHVIEPAKLRAIADKR